MGLELVDDLHRADLRRTGKRSRRQHRPQGVHRGDAGTQGSRDLADDVEHVGVSLDDHQLVDLDRSVLAHPAEVVPAEVHEHHVLGALLRVAEQLVGLPLVLLLAGAARVSARDRAGFGPAATDLHQRLG